MSLLLDISGFEALFQVHYQPLCATAYRIVQDKAIAEGIVQNVFRKVWERRDLLKVAIPLKAYLTQTTINHSIYYTRKYGDSLKGDKQWGPEAEADIKFTAHLMALKEVGSQIDVAVKSLPDVCRMIFILSRYEQLSYNEIAACLNISVKVVENQMAKALEHLRKYLLITLFLIICNFLLTTIGV